MTAPSRASPISRGGSKLPTRMIVHGVEGVGKSSLLAHAPKPVFGMTHGETGLLSLIDNGQLAETDHFDEFDTWAQIGSAINYLIVEDTGHKAFVLDTLNGAERLCFESVCQGQFGGSWEKFGAYGKGPDIAQAEWIKFLTDLDRLRARRNMAIACLVHTKVKTFKNPEGDDYDRYTPDMHEKTWGLSAKWADMVLFGNFETFAKKDRGALKAKGVGGENRVLYTQRTAAWDAKNRHGLPPEIPMGKSAAESWKNLLGAMKAARPTVPDIPATGHVAASASLTTQDEMAQGVTEQG